MKLPIDSKNIEHVKSCIKELCFRFQVTEFNYDPERGSDFILSKGGLDRLIIGDHLIPVDEILN